MNFYANTPVESAILAQAIQFQDKIVSTLLQTEIFGLFLTICISIGMVIWIGKLGLRSVSVNQALGEVMIRLCIVIFGTTMLTTQRVNPVPIVSPSGKDWSDFDQIRRSHPEIAIGGQGLSWYVWIHSGFTGLGSWLTELASNVAQEGNFQTATDGTLRIVAQASRVMFDDPKILELFHKLDTNCLKKDSQITGLQAGLMSFYDLSTSFCRDNHRDLMSSLKGWASANVGWFDRQRVAVGTCSFYFWCNRTALENALIAFATRNMAEDQYIKTLGVHSELLFQGEAITNAAKTNTGNIVPQVTRFTAAGAMYVDRLLSAHTIEQVFFHSMTGSWNDTYSNDFRNHAAKTYDQLLTLLPAIRGWTQAALAGFFVIAAGAMCIGIVEFMFRWLIMVALLSLYEPISAIMYYIVRGFMDISLVSVGNAQSALDPTQIGVAQYLVTEVAEVQTVYFGLQVILIAGTCWIGRRFFDQIQFKPYFTSQQFAKVSQAGTTIVRTISPMKGVK